MTCWRASRVIRSRAGRADLYMPNIGPMELVIVLVIALVVLGPKRLPDAGKAVGKGMREFKESLSGNAKDDDLDVDYEPGSIERDSSSATT
jgi:sec-independent protein translocase protein TatA